MITVLFLFIIVPYLSNKINNYHHEKCAKSKLYIILYNSSKDIIATRL